MDFQVSDERDAARIAVGTPANQIRLERNYGLGYVRTVYSLEVERIGERLRYTWRRETGPAYYSCIFYPKGCLCFLCLAARDAAVISFYNLDLDGDGTVIHVTLVNAAECLRIFGGAKVHQTLRKDSNLKEVEDNGKKAGS